MEKEELMETLVAFCSERHATFEKERVSSTRWLIGILVTVLIFLGTLVGTLIGRNTMIITKHENQIEIMEGRWLRMDTKIDAFRTNMDVKMDKIQESINVIALRVK